MIYHYKSDHEDTEVSGPVRIITKAEMGNVHCACITVKQYKHKTKAKKVGIHVSRRNQVVNLSDMIDKLAHLTFLILQLP